MRSFVVPVALVVSTLCGMARADIPPPNRCESKAAAGTSCHLDDGSAGVCEEATRTRHLPSKDGEIREITSRYMRCVAKVGPVPSATAEPSAAASASAAAAIEASDAAVSATPPSTPPAKSCGCATGPEGAGSSALFVVAMAAIQGWYRRRRK